MSFKIIVDSCCDLSPYHRKSEAFLSVPLTLSVGGHTVVDDETFDQKDMLRRMDACEKSPQTACPSPAQYMDAFDCGVDDIYVVTLSALLSGSHNSAAQARMLWMEEHPETNIHIFNSCSAAAGEVILALKLRELAESGLDFATVVSKGSQFIREMQTYFVLENLDNLRKNGRLSKVQSIVTSTLKIKLFMGATPEGEICKHGQALSIKQALGKMVTAIAADKRHINLPLCISHCNCLERALYLKEQIMKSCQCSEIIITDAGGVTTVYANDGGVVVAF